MCTAPSCSALQLLFKLQLHCTAAAATISLSLALTVISLCTALSCNWMCNCSSDSEWSEWSGQDNQTPPITVTQMQLSKNALGKLHFGKVHFVNFHFGTIDFRRVQFSRSYTLGQSDTAYNCNSNESFQKCICEITL